MTDYVTPDWERAALITIDTQRDFTVPGGPFVIPGTLEIVPAMARLGRAFRARGRPVVHVVRLYLADGTNADLCRRDDIERGQRMGVPGTAGAELMDDLLPPPGASLDAASLLAGERQPVGPREWIMYKPRWGPSTARGWRNTSARSTWTPSWCAAATSPTARARRSTRRASAARRNCGTSE